MTDPDELVRLKHFHRNYFRMAVSAMPAGFRRREVLAAAAALARLPAFRRAGTVGLYLSMKGEFDTTPLIALARKAGKRVAVPVVFPETREIRFCLLEEGKPLAKNVYGIPEPVPRARRFIPPKELDLLLVPGRAFTRQGLRLGMGGGYYDRFLARHPRIPAVGLAHSVQIASGLPAEMTDFHVRPLI